MAGVVAGQLLWRPTRPWTVPILAAAAVLPDVDFLLPIPHRGPLHSVGAVAVVFAAVVAARWHRSDRLAAASAIALAYGSHVLLDWLGTDTFTPRGVMVLWPFSSAFYVSGLDVFAEISRRYWMEGFWRQNTIAILREIVILALPFALVWRRAQFHRR